MYFNPSFSQQAQSSFSLFSTGAQAAPSRKRGRGEIDEAVEVKDAPLGKKLKDDLKSGSQEPEKELSKMDEAEDRQESPCGLVHDHFATILTPNVERLKAYLMRCPTAFHYDADSVQTFSMAIIKIQRFGEIAFFVQRNLKILAQVEREKAQGLMDKYSSLMQDLKVTVVNKLREEIEHMQSLKPEPDNAPLTQNRMKIVKQLHEIGALFTRELDFLAKNLKNSKPIAEGTLHAPVDIANAIQDLKKRVHVFSEVVEQEGISAKGDALLQQIGAQSRQIQNQLQLLSQKQAKLSVALSYLHYTAISNLRDFFATFIRKNLSLQKDQRGFLDFVNQRQTFIHNIFTEQQ